MAGVHPNSKMPGTYTQVPYCHRATSAECRGLAPGAYEIAVGGFSERSVQQRSQGPGWRRAQEVARLAGIPHMLYKEQWNHKKFLRENLGPGRYTIKNFIMLNQSRPSSHRGVCQSTGPRLGAENKFLANLPGPGNYGAGGVPSRLMEESSKKSPSTVGMMDCGGKNIRIQPTVGCHLAPGQYIYKGSIDQLLCKTTGKKGPYNLFTGDRAKSAKSAKNRHLGPGTYQIPSTLLELEDRNHKPHGQFAQDVQYPSRPYQRIFCSTLSQCPRDDNEPGPGHYTGVMATPNGRPQTAYNPNVSFGFTSERFNRQSQQNFSGTANPVAVGQYSLVRWDLNQHRNGNVSVFRSTTPRLPIKVNSSREQLIWYDITATDPPVVVHTLRTTSFRDSTNG